MTPSSEIDDEIARLMRDPNALRSDPSLTPDSDIYDNARPPLGAAQLAQLGSGNPAGPSVEPAPFNGEFGNINAAQHLTSQNGFIQTERAHPRSERTQDLFVTADRRYRFVTPIPATPEQIPGGTRWIISATTYAYDRTTGAYATIPATPARPMLVTDSNGRLSVRPFNRQWDSR